MSLQENLMCAQISFTLSKTYSLNMTAIIIVSPAAKERSCSLCVGRHLQSSALLLFNAFPARGSQPASHIKLTPECLSTAAAVSAEKEQKTFLITELGPSPSHYKNQSPTLKKKSHFAAGGQLLRIGNHAIFQVCYCTIQKDLKTSSFQYKSMQSVQLQGMQLLALLSVFPAGKYFSLSYIALC